MKMNTESHYQFQSILSEIICYHNTTTINQQDSLLPYHRHDAYEIYLFIQGNTKLYLERSCYQLCCGDMAMINSNELHRSVCSDNQPYERYGINIKPLLIERLSSSHTNLMLGFEHLSGKNHLFHLSTEQIKDFIFLYHSLAKSLSSNDYGHDILVRADISRILVFVNKLYQHSSFTSTNIMPKMIQDVMEYIKVHLTETITLDTLSKQFFLNGSYISQQFKHYTGLTLRSYILDQQINMAKTLLLEGKNVTESCALSGFSDYSNFIRSFTKQVGISPGKYKQYMLH